ncbi:hypothetical protein MTO96_030479, partial [Rhipicephalus appendiculatus]
MLVASEPVARVLSLGLGAETGSPIERTAAAPAAPASGASKNKPAREISSAPVCRDRERDSSKINRNWCAVSELSRGVQGRLHEFQSLVGENVSAATKRLLLYIMEDAVAQHFSWVGSKGKHKFRDLNGTTVIMDAVRSNKLFETT